MTHCGKCHTCGAQLAHNDWCPTCSTTRRYWSHGFSGPDAEDGGSCYDVLIDARPELEDCDDR